MLAAGVGAWVVSHRAPDTSQPPIPVKWQEADLVNLPRMVTIDGMAHYTATVHQDVPGNLIRKPKEYWLYGFFAPYDTDGRAIRLMVRTDREPEDLVSYELVRITGLLSRATPDKVPYQAEVMFGKESDYFFTDEMLLLEPTAFEPIGGDD